MILIDAEDQVLGRLCTIAAKKALLGEKVVVVNADKAVISGEKKTIIAENLDKLTRRNKGNYRRGPFHQKRADRFVRKKIRGMLPYKKTRGREAYRNIQVYTGVPDAELEKKHGVNLEKTKMIRPDASQKALRRCMTVGELCKSIGGKE